MKTECEKANIRGLVIVVKKMTIRLLSILFFVLYLSCTRDSFFYLTQLSEDLHISIESNEASSSNFGNNTFYIVCDKDHTFSKLTYIDILNGYLDNKKKMSPSEYVNKLFLSQLKIKEQICSPLDDGVIFP